MKVTGEKLGFWHGLLIGLGLVLVVWLVELSAARQLPIIVQTIGLGLVSLVMLALSGLAGWLTARGENMGVTILLWLGTAVLLVLLMGYAPFQGRTFVPWLADRRFWGLPLTTPGDRYNVALVIAGFAILLLLLALAVLQETRLTAVRDALDNQGRFTFRAGLLLALPLPLVIGAGLVMTNIIGRSSIRPLKLVDTVIQNGRAYDGNLFQLALETGLNYPAIADVRPQLSGAYTLQVGEIHAFALTGTVTIVAQFESGFRVNCPVTAESLAPCYAVQPSYAQGLAALLSGQPPPAGCPDCRITADDEWLAWLQAQRPELGPQPHVRLLRQWGSTVALEIGSADSEYTVECHLQGIISKRLVRCDGL